MTLIDLAQNEVFGPPIDNEQYQCDIFVVMPFRENFNILYDENLKSVAEKMEYTIKRGDDFQSKSGIMAEVWSAIYHAKVVICDCSLDDSGGHNANVYYELGIAHALNKPVIMIRSNIDNVPFDLNYLRFTVYEDTLAGRAQLEKVLVKAIEPLLSDVRLIENLKENPEDLPSDKDDQMKVIETLLRQEDFETFDKILPYIKGIKVRVIRKLIEIKEIDRATNLTSTLQAAGSLKSVGVALYDAGYTDTPVMQDVIRRTVNNTERRALARHIYHQNGEESSIFRAIVDKITNGTDIRSLGVYFLNDDRFECPAFDYLIDRLGKIRNSSQLTVLAREFVDRGIANTSQMYRIANTLEFKIDVAKEVIIYWAESSCDTAAIALKNKVVKNEELAQFLQECVEECQGRE